MSDFKAIILAGGSGERFWPLSTPEKPKQFLRVFGGASLIRQSVTRLQGLVAPQDVFVITSDALVAATRKELPEIPKANIIGEPMRRDTGAAVALGVGVASRTGGDAGPSGRKGCVLGFFPADQLATNPVKFRATVKKAIRLASHPSSRVPRPSYPIVTIGIKPEYPATQFGYVNPKTGAFVEKPNARKAKDYLKKGYLWNAGMFIGRSEAFKAAFAKHAPELVGILSAEARRHRDIERAYEKLPKISFDYAVMEKLKNVGVVKGDFGWDDVGSYGAFDKYFPHDSRGNVREGPCTVVEADGNICVARSARISLLGVKNLVVVTTPDAVLVADKSRITEMKRLFGAK